MEKPNPELFNSTEYMSPAELLSPEEEMGFTEVSEITDYYGTTKIYKIPTLPDIEISDEEGAHNFAYKGGAARQALELALGIGSKLPPRDIDAIRLGDEYVEAPSTWEVDHPTESAKLGTQNEGFAEYMKTRDLTINEVLLLAEADGSWHVYATREAIFDTINNVISPSCYEAGPSRQQIVSSRLTCRAIRMAAERRLEDPGVELALTTEQISEVSSFDIALQLQRATESAAENEYVELCRNYGIIDESINTPAELFEILKEELGYYASSFRFDMEIMARIDEVQEDADDIEPITADAVRKYSKLIRDKKLSEEDLTLS